ncbi:hypothetical protein [Cellulosimicrobium cellulans]|uniref:hypothetical protein n=1 Tax=Cellulosimicrobium cellulans TaxID=1710 RepID=UPI0012FDA6E5|nr:hypothetical protein [Cellulosimicrobium cellulans]
MTALRRRTTPGREHRPPGGTARRRGPAALVAAVATAALAVGIVVAPAAPVAVAAEATVTVDLADSTGSPNEGIGRGFLYGLSRDGSGPSDDLLLPLRPTSFRSGGEIDEVGTRGWAFGQAQFEPRYAAMRDQALRVTNPPYDATFDMILSDLWGSDGSGTRPNPIPEPCDDGPTCAEWVAFLTELVDRLDQDGLLKDSVRFDIWNEPAENSYFWPRSQAQYHQMWNAAVRTLRDLYPDAVIVGPSIPNYHWPTLQSYLDQAKAAGTMPDIWNWHFSGEPLADAAEARARLADAGFAGMPIAMNEYLYSDQQFPGFSAWYLAQLQRAGYESASHAIWSDCCDQGLLDGLLVRSGGDLLTTGRYWVYKASADATGEVVRSVPAGGVEVLATRDQGAARASVLLGSRGTFTGTLTLRVENVPAWLRGGGEVHAVVERLADGVQAAPAVVSSAPVTLSGSTATIAIPWAAAKDAYSVRLSPQPGGPVTPPGDVTVDANATGPGAFTYSAGWGSTTGIADMYAGTARWSPTAGSTASFTFTGTSVDLYTVRDTDQGRMNVTVDGGPPVLVDNYAASRTGSALRWSSGTLPAGTHTVTVTVTGTKSAESSHTTVALDKVVHRSAAPTVTTVDSSTTTGTHRFAYGAGWGTTTGVPDLYAGTASWSSGADRTATFTFTGARVDLYTVRDTDQGIAEIRLDGGPPVLVDGWRASRQAGAVTWTSGPLAPGAHTVTVRSTGTRDPASTGFTVALDRADVTA